MLCALTAPNHVVQVLRRDADPGEPVALMIHLELADRWCADWQKATFAPGESFEFDLGDRRRVSDLSRYLEIGCSATLMLTKTKPTVR